MQDVFPPLQFRFAHPSNALALAEIMTCAIERKHGRRTSSPGREEAIKDEALYLQRDMSDGNRILMACYPYQPVGFINYKFSEHAALYVDHIYAYSEEITGGIGSALLKKTLALDNVKSLTLFPAKGTQDMYSYMCFDQLPNGDMQLTGNALDAWRNCEYGNYPRRELAQ